MTDREGGRKHRRHSSTSKRTDTPHSVSAKNGSKESSSSDPKAAHSHKRKEVRKSRGDPAERRKSSPRSSGIGSSSGSKNQSGRKRERERGGSHSSNSAKKSARMMNDRSCTSASRSESPVPRPEIIPHVDPTRNSQGDPFPPDLSGPWYIKLLLEPQDTPVLLGVDNRGVVNLAKTAQGRARLSGKDSPFPGTQRRMLLLYGSDGSLNTMINLILEKLSGSPAHKGSGQVPKDLKLTFIIPCAAVALTCKDSQGVSLRRAKELFGARVHLHPRRQADDLASRERLLEVEGCLSAIKSAALCIAATLQGYEYMRDHMNVAYLGGAELPKPVKSPPPAPPDGVMEHDSNLVVDADGMLVPPTPGASLPVPGADESIVQLARLRQVRDEHSPEMQGPAYHKLMVGDPVASLILGEDGTQILQFEKKYDIQAKVLDQEVEGSSERIIIISGEPGNADRALFGVLEKIYAAALIAYQPTRLVWRVCVSAGIASLIIGPHGDRLRAVRTLTGTRIQITSREGLKYASGEERLISVTGCFSGVVLAVKWSLPFYHADQTHNNAVHTQFGVGKRLPLPFWAESLFVNDGLDEVALRQPPLKDKRVVVLMGPVYMKLLIDHGTANVLAANDSAQLRAITESAGCTIKLQDPENCYPESRDRVLLISGSAEAVSMAFVKLHDACRAAHPLLPIEYMYAKLCVPRSCCPLVIGPSGSRIREVRESTNTRISLSHSALVPERAFLITGSPRGVHQAVLTLCIAAQTDPNVQKLMEADYKQLAEEEADKSRQEQELANSLLDAVLDGVQSVATVTGSNFNQSIQRLQEMKAVRDLCPKTMNARVVLPIHFTLVSKFVSLLSKLILNFVDRLGLWVNALG